jgi:hypothetical protein
MWLSKYWYTSSSEELKCLHHLPVTTTFTNNNHSKYLNRMTVEILKHQNFSDQNKTHKSCTSTSHINTILIQFSVSVNQQTRLFTDIHTLKRIKSSISATGQKSQNFLHYNTVKLGFHVPWIYAFSILAVLPNPTQEKC